MRLTGDGPGEHLGLVALAVAQLLGCGNLPVAKEATLTCDEATGSDGGYVLRLDAESEAAGSRTVVATLALSNSSGTAVWVHKGMAPNPQTLRLRATAWGPDGMRLDDCGVLPDASQWPPANQDAEETASGVGQVRATSKDQASEDRIAHAPPFLLRWLPEDYALLTHGQPVSLKLDLSCYELAGQEVARLELVYDDQLADRPTCFEGHPFLKATLRSNALIMSAK